jgi:hypothetical protein
MTEPLIEQLKQLTPDGAGLDRDELLFAAGRASARPPRRWQALAGLLAACQLATLLWLRPGTTPPPPPSEPPPEVAVWVPDPEPPAGLLAGRGTMPPDAQVLDGGGLPSGMVELFAPSEPPLHACATRPAWLRE